MNNIKQKSDRIIDHCRSFLGRLLKDVGGISGVILTISLIPTIGVIGAATDISRAYIVKTRLRAALDAAALAGGRSFFDANREAQIKKYFEANFPSGYFGTMIKGPYEVNAAGGIYPSGHIYNQNDTVLRLKVSATIPTLFMKLFSFNDMNVGGHSEVTRQTSFLDVVIAVDMSGSMLRAVNGSWGGAVPDQRIELAKTAASNLVNILFGAATKNALLSIGLVPWAGRVKVTEPGTRYSYDSYGNSIPHSALFTTKNIPSSPNNPYDEAFYRIDKHHDGNIWNNADDLVLKNWTPKINKVYYAHNAPSVPLLAEPPANWQGYVYARYARTKPYNVPQSYSDYTAEAQAGDLVDGPFTSPGGKAWVGWYPMGSEGEKTFCDLGVLNGGKYYCSSGPAEGILPLQHVKSTILDAINNLYIPSGGIYYTNIPQGLAWAWRTITPGKPFNQATVVNNPNFVKHKAIILLTDGQNTVISGDAYNGGFTSEARRDSRLRKLADVIKNKNDSNPKNDDEILIYTIQFANANSKMADLLKYVATSNKYYFYAPDRASLQKAFKKIAEDLSNLRLSK